MQITILGRQHHEGPIPGYLFTYVLPGWAEGTRPCRVWINTLGNDSFTALAQALKECLCVDTDLGPGLVARALEYAYTSQRTDEPALIAITFTYRPRLAVDPLTN